MSERDQLAAVLDAAGPAAAGGLAAMERRLATVAAGHGDVLGNHAGGTLAAGGKRLRPLLVFLCAGEGAGQGVGDEAGAGAPSPLVAAAVAVELLHTATLVHDDVLDRAALRRGRPTVFATDGAAAATATGDLLFSRAFAELAATGDAGAVRALSVASTALARGELLQRADAWSPDVGVERYLERCALKTGSLFAASCRLGALLGGRADAADALAAFGADVGLAFQILDDVLDISGPPERTGKHRGTDLLDGTVTLPLILARQRDDALRTVDLRSVATADDAESLCDSIAATGALDAARGRALELVAATKRRLAELDLEAGRRRTLDLVADGVVARYS